MSKHIKNLAVLWWFLSGVSNGQVEFSKKAAEFLETAKADGRVIIATYNISDASDFVELLHVGLRPMIIKILVVNRQTLEIHPEVETKTRGGSMFGKFTKGGLYDVSFLFEKKFDSLNSLFSMNSPNPFLLKVNFRYLQTDNVGSMEHMFGNCPSLIKIDFSGFNTKNVGNMQFMFFGCTSLTSLDLSSFDTENVVNMSCMFAFCSSLKSLDLSHFNFCRVKEIETLCKGCKNLQKINLGNFDFTLILNMAGLFSDCESLTTIEYGDNYRAPREFVHVLGCLNKCKHLKGNTNVKSFEDFMDVLKKNKQKEGSCCCF